MFLRFFFFSLFIFNFMSSFSYADEPKTTSYCDTLTGNYKSIPASLVEQLGEWESCERTYYSEDSSGMEEKFAASWNFVKLTAEFRESYGVHSAIYIVKTSGANKLTSEWYDKERDNLVSSDFEMRWDFDEFPGPTAEYYVSKESGWNAQLWVERDSNGGIEWMRFSYIS